MQVVVSPEPCADWHTLVMTHYVNPIAPRRSLFELQKGCLDMGGDADSPSLTGPEVLTGMTLRSDYGEGGSD